MEHKSIYFDYNATTPIDPAVLEVMMPYLTDAYGNAASAHFFGQAAKGAVETARVQLAELIGAEPREIIFTSGATESDNLAIKGVAEIYAEKGKHIITCATEHPAVLDTCDYLEAKGWRITRLGVDEFGRVSPDAVADAITPETVLVSIMAANNETGTVHPLEQIGAICHERGVIFHTDAAQAVGKIPIDVQRMQIDLMSISGHKIYAPKGVGALYVRGKGPRVRLACQMHGGGHESKLRSGTINVPGVVGIGAAAARSAELMDEESARIRGLRDRLVASLTAQIDCVKLNGHPTQRLPNTANLSFAYVEGEAIIGRMQDIACSTGSACSSASLSPSHVLEAMGVSDELSHGAIRLSLGRFTTQEQVDYAVGKFVQVVEQLRQMSPFYEAKTK